MEFPKAENLVSVMKFLVDREIKFAVRNRDRSGYLLLTILQVIDYLRSPEEFFDKQKPRRRLRVVPKI